MNNDKEMNIREKSYYRFKKFTRFLKEKKLYGRFKKKGGRYNSNQTLHKQNHGGYNGKNRKKR